MALTIRRRYPSGFNSGGQWPLRNPAYEPLKIEKPRQGADRDLMLNRRAQGSARISCFDRPAA
jgi:hypothetical protein